MLSASPDGQKLATGYALTHTPGHTHRHAHTRTQHVDVHTFTNSQTRHTHTTCKHAHAYTHHCNTQVPTHRTLRASTHMRTLTHHRGPSGIVNLYNVDTAMSSKTPTPCACRFCHTCTRARAHTEPALSWYTQASHALTHTHTHTRPAHTHPCTQSTLTQSTCTQSTLTQSTHTHTYTHTHTHTHTYPQTHNTYTHPHARTHTQIHTHTDKTFDHLTTWSSMFAWSHDSQIFVFASHEKKDSLKMVCVGGGG